MGEVRPLQDYVLGPFLIADAEAAASSQKIPVPMKGQIVGIASVQVPAISVAAGLLTLKKNGVAMTGVTSPVTIGDAGLVVNTEISPNLITGDVDESDELEVACDGVATGAGVVTVMVRIRR
jgi:hypothetical protein